MSLSVSVLFTCMDVHFIKLTTPVHSIRFRAAWKAQGHSLEELPFKVRHSFLLPSFMADINVNNRHLEGPTAAGLELC